MMGGACDLSGKSHKREARRERLTVRMRAEKTDEELLLSGDPDDFGEFYRRHARSLLGFLARRTDNAEAAADLVAETFAAAVLARRRFKPGPTPAVGWLYGIAGHKLADFQRRGRAEARARQKLGLERRPLSTIDVDLIRAAAEEVSFQIIQTLPVRQRDAVRAHVLEDRPYGDIALEQNTSEQVIRKRVSRGLMQLRSKVEGRR